MTVPAPIFTAVKELLRTNEIVEISIIDDAYYTTPQRSAFTNEELAELAERMQSWQDPTPEFTALQLTIETEADITDVVLQSIYPLRANSPEVQTWFTHYDNVQEQRRAQLRPLENLLRTELECNVSVSSPQTALDPDHLPHVIFIDYYLDPINQVPNSLELAASIGEQVKQAFTDIPKPLVILMSSHDGLTDLAKAQFRKTANFLGGMFYFLPKEKLQPNVAFLLQLAVLIRSLKDGHQVQEFVDAFEREIGDTTTKFRDKVRALSLEDYAYIQKLSLHGEGMPLGDYLLWLFGTYFAHLLFRSVPKQRRQLDAIHFAHIAESDSMPSEEFIELYSGVVSEEVDGLGTHPRAKPPSEAGELGPPDPHFGDVFVNDKQEVQMVITGECDLLYAPEEDADRKHQPQDSVFIIPGKLEEMTLGASDEDLVTSFFSLGGKIYQIGWQFKNVRSIPYGELRAYVEGAGFQRRARIRHPFATLVQAHFANNMTRVAIPVAPPMLKEVSVSVHYAGPEGAPATRHSPVRGILYKDRKARTDHVHLKLQTAVQIVEVAQHVLAETEGALENEPPGQGRTRLESARDRLIRFLADLDLHMQFRQPFKLKPEGKYPFPESPVEAVRDAKILAQRIKSVSVVVFVQEEAETVEEPPAPTTAAVTADPIGAERAISPVVPGPGLEEAAPATIIPPTTESVAPASTDDEASGSTEPKEDTTG